MSASCSPTKGNETNRSPPAFTGRGFLASLDGNRSVGTSDLLALLANWGP